MCFAAHRRSGKTVDGDFLESVCGLTFHDQKAEDNSDLFASGKTFDKFLIANDEVLKVNLASVDSFDHAEFKIQLTNAIAETFEMHEEVLKEDWSGVTDQNQVAAILFNSSLPFLVACYIKETKGGESVKRCRQIVQILCTLPHSLNGRLTQLGIVVNPPCLMKHFNLSVEKFKQLAMKNKFTVKEINQAYKYYGGYRSVGVDGTSHRFTSEILLVCIRPSADAESTVLTPSSVEAFALMQDSAYIEWVNTGSFPPGTPDSVVSGSERCVVDLTKPFDINQLMDLKRLSNTKKDLDNPDQLKLFLIFLFYRGYLTKANSGGNKERVKLLVLNKEIALTLQKYMVQSFRLERTLMAAVSGYLESSEVFRSNTELKFIGRVYRPVIHAAVDAYVKHMIEHVSRNEENSYFSRASSRFIEARVLIFYPAPPFALSSLLFLRRCKL
uniref:Uncharacterized protein n=1 Tax=Ditylenchus dipsaci TaxID=166011 RepID=A0A915CQZ9_9BILA